MESFGSTPIAKLRAKVAYRLHLRAGVGKAVPDEVIERLARQIDRQERRTARPLSRCRYRGGQ
ncbi:hypothetical protein QFZ67_004853 [Streptomyces sp. V1I1]|nr:hypothetical protein [Streptomyces sp. V1I1]